MGTNRTETVAKQTTLESSSSSSSNQPAGKQGGDGDGATTSASSTASAVYRIPRLTSQGARDLAYQKKMLGALTELRILAGADRVRLNHHKSTLKQCRHLGICPKSLRIGSYNVPNLMPTSKVIAKLDDLIRVTEMKKLDIFISHYKEIYDEYVVLIDKISAHIAKITENSPELQDRLTEIDRLENVALAEMREREQNLERFAANKIENLAKEKITTLKKAKDRDTKRQFRKRILGVLFHSPSKSAASSSSSTPTGVNAGNSSDSSTAAATTNAPKKGRKGKEPLMLPSSKTTIEQGDSSSLSSSSTTTPSATLSSKSKSDTDGDNDANRGKNRSDPLAQWSAKLHFRPKWETDETWEMARKWSTILPAIPLLVPTSAATTNRAIVPLIEFKRSSALKRKYAELRNDGAVEVFDDIDNVDEWFDPKPSEITTTTTSATTATSSSTSTTTTSNQTSSREPRAKRGRYRKNGGGRKQRLQ